MTTLRPAAALLAAALALAACGGTSDDTADTTSRDAGASDDGSAAADDSDLLTTTPAGTSEVDRVVWNLSGGEPASLDPITFFNGSTNYPLANMCESLMLQLPDGTIEPGLAASVDRPDATTVVFTLREGVTFWDGSPLTADDVVHSLTRAQDADFALGSGYSDVFAAVESIEATDPATVTITLTRPDELLVNRLSSAAGAVSSRAFVEAAGADHGSPDGGLMCTGPFSFGTWASGDSLTLERNDNWWRAEDAGLPLVEQLEFVFVTDTATYTAAMLSGEIDGMFEVDAPAYDRLVAEGAPVYQGRSVLIGELSFANLAGDMGSPELRRALALALDYEGIRQAAFGGLGDPARALQPPYLGGEQQPVYGAAYAELPELVQDRAAAEQLVADSGVADPAIVIGTAAGIQEQTTVGLAVQEAAEAIGIAAEVRELTLDEFGGLYVPGSDIGQEIDVFFLTDASIVPDPAAFYSYVGSPEGFGNWAGYQNDEVVALLEQVGAETDPQARAELTVQVQELVMQDLPFIPLAHRWNTTFLREGLTGAVVSAPATLFSPWAVGLGGA